MTTLELELKDIYQLLISECRYGYTRNNHLMPGGAYDKVKRIIPKMYEVDNKYALCTLEQLCEECISEQICWNFFEGYDDEFNNRFNAIKFVYWCLDYIHTHGDKNYKPYNYNQFLDNLEKDKEKRYNVYEVGKHNKQILVNGPLCLEDAKNYIFKNNCDTKGVATFRNFRINKAKKHPDFKYILLYPVEKTYIIKHI